MNTLARLVSVSGDDRREARLTTFPGSVEHPIINSTRLVKTVSVACALGTMALLAPVVSNTSADGMSFINPFACNPSALSQPFARWSDFADYELAPGGDFESSTWTLTRRAKLVGGSEPYAATGTLGSSSLSLPNGSSAKSPPTCVDLGYPSIRFFIAGEGSVAVNVVDKGLVIPVGVAAAGGVWSPSPVMLTISPVLGLVSGGTAEVSLTFTSLSGSPQIDDVFVDPYCHG
jgi:hypothetical protein